MKRKLPYIAALLFAAAAVLPLSAKEGHRDITELIETAKTPADHEAIAEHFEHAAKRAKARAEEHRKMGASYKKMGAAFTEKWHLDQHCKSIAAGYDAAAKENEALAAAHREMAKKAK